MFKRDEKEYEVWSPPEIPGGRGRLIGRVRCAVGYRSDEEATEDDVARLNISAAATAPVRLSPAGGFTRGCVLKSADGTVFTVRRALKGRRLWMLKLSGCIADGE